MSASVQPQHVVDDMPVAALGLPDGGLISYRFRDLLNAGIPLALGSDAPVSIPNPLWTLHAAVTRQDAQNRPEAGWHPAQRLSLAEAIYAHTMGPALISGRHRELGSISQGKFADMVLLDTDLYKVEPARIRDARVMMTVFNGELAYQA